MAAESESKSIIFKPNNKDFMKMINSKGAERESLLYVMDVVLLTDDKKKIVVNTKKDDELYNSGGMKDVGLYAHVSKGGMTHYYKTFYVSFGVYEYTVLDRQSAEEFLIRHQDGLKTVNLKKHGFDIF